MAGGEASPTYFARGSRSWPVSAEAIGQQGNCSWPGYGLIGGCFPLTWLVAGSELGDSCCHDTAIECARLRGNRLYLLAHRVAVVIGRSWLSSGSSGTHPATDVAPALAGCLMVSEPKVCHDRSGGSAGPGR
jgi:hypothetical protein